MKPGFQRARTHWEHDFMAFPGWQLMAFPGRQLMAFPGWQLMAFPGRQAGRAAAFP